ncbi:MAG: acetate--CoA ligase family protein [Planctomycetes bacterium]|nr:acetate--CoA ligase family protein [Planctomycetota bacterium]
MARLHEYQGKALLGEHGIPVPRGRAVSSAAAAREFAANLGVPVVLKAQAWVTGRKAKGGVVFADDPDQAAVHAEKLLSMSFGNFPVTEVLVEETIDIRDELFVSLSIDDAAQAPVLLLDCQGGSGIEDRASSVARLPVDVTGGLAPELIQQELSKSSIDESFHEAIVDAIVKAVDLAREIEARSLEINPLVTTGDGRVMAADCRIAIDDYAVFRQEKLGIEIARELDHPPSDLERIAYTIEQADHRGTFYFAQLPTDGEPGSKGLIGFHGAGGGGSMMSMDAVTSLPGGGFTLACEPREITLFDVYKLFELGEDWCPFGASACSDDAPCEFHEKMIPVRAAMKNLLHETTFDVFQRPGATTPRSGRKSRKKKSKTKRRSYRALPTSSSRRFFFPPHLH